MKRLLPLIVITLVSTNALAGFGEEAKIQQEKEMADRLGREALVGRQFYLQTKDCLLSTSVYEVPETKYGVSKYTTDVPVRMTVMDYVEQQGRQNIYAMSKYYVVELEGGVKGYIEYYELGDHKISTNFRDSTTYCLTTYDPKAREAYFSRARAAQIKKEAAEAARQAAQRKKPGVSIGMTDKQVMEQTSWGRPLRVNRTTTAGVVDEQWVYNGGYLYFRNGILRSIQN